MIMSELLTQNEMDELLFAITSPEMHESRKKNNAIDFRHLKKISERECFDLSRCFEGIKCELEDFIFSKWGINVNSHLCGVVSAQVEELFREVSGGCPVIAFDWLGGSGMFTMDKSLFYRGFLNSCKKENMNGLEKSIFCNQIYIPFIKLIRKEISKAALGNQSEIENHRIIRNAHSFLKAPDYSGMGVYISLIMKIGDEEGFVHLFWDGDIIENLRKYDFFKCHDASNVFALSKPESDTVVEAGRFRLEDNIAIEPGMIFELNKFHGEPLNVIKNNRIVARGEGTLIDDHFAIRIQDAEEEEILEDQDNFYNAKVIFGQCKTADNEEFWEGKILVLDEYVDEKAKIVVGNKVIALGEFFVLDENINVTITQVFDN